MKCKLHPKYKAIRKPTSKDYRCTCRRIWRAELCRRRAMATAQTHWHADRIAWDYRVWRARLDRIDMAKWTGIFGGCV